MSSKMQLQNRETGPRRNAAQIAWAVIAAIGRGIAKLVRVVVIERFQRRMRQEAAYRALMTMSDHQLRDIGLARSDIYAAVVGAYTRTGTEPAIAPVPSDDTEAEAEPPPEARRSRPSEPSGQTQPVTARRSAKTRGRQATGREGAGRPRSDHTENDGLAV